jgi:uncharacterized protein (DUF2062 family)
MVQAYIKKIHKKVRHLAKKTTPDHNIGLGFAIGSFWSLLFTPGLSIILALAHAFVQKNADKVSVLFGLAVCNPLVSAPLYAICVPKGTFFLTETQASGLFSTSVDFIARFYTCNSYFALTISLLLYCIVRISVKLLRKETHWW